MSDSVRFAIIILNYRTPRLVLDCLATLADQVTVGCDCAIVVDSASGDDSADQIAAAIAHNGWQAWTHIERLATNRGFSAGNNAGMIAADALAGERPFDGYLLLNSDTLLRPGALAILRAALAEHPRAGIISPRLEWPDGTPQISCFKTITPGSELLAAARTGPLSRLLRRHEVAIDISSTPIEADWTSFAAVLLRRDAVLDVGPLDEGYFMYFEDVDYGRRLWQTGWRLLHWPAARIVHLRGGTSEVKAATQARTRRPAYYYAARARYFAKFYGGRPGLVLTNTLWAVGRAIALLRERLGSKAPHTCHREERDIWINWDAPLRTPG